MFNLINMPPLFFDLGRDRPVILSELGCILDKCAVYIEEKVSDFMEKLDISEPPQDTVGDWFANDDEDRYDLRPSLGTFGVQVHDISD